MKILFQIQKCKEACLFALWLLTEHKHILQTQAQLDLHPIFHDNYFKNTLTFFKKR